MALQSIVNQLLGFVQQAEPLTNAYPVLYGWLLRNRNFLLSDAFTDEAADVTFANMQALNAMFSDGNFESTIVQSLWTQIWYMGFVTNWTFSDMGGYFVMSGPPFPLYIGYESADKILQVFTAPTAAGTPIGVFTQVLYTSPSQGYNNQEVSEVDFGGVFTWRK